MTESINELMNESMTRLFVGQPRLHRVCQTCYYYMIHLFKARVESLLKIFLYCTPNNKVPQYAI